MKIRDSKKNTKSNFKKYRSDLLVISFFIILFLFFYIYSHYSTRQLEAEATCTKGIISGLKGVRGGWDVEFYYFVDGVKFISSDSYSIKYDRFSFGDTCFVKYARSNPENCKLENVNIDGHKVLKLKRRTDNPPILTAPR